MEKNYYKKLITLSNEWKKMGERNNRIASLHQNTISGGPDLTDDWAKQETARLAVFKHIKRGVEGGARLSYLLTVAQECALNKHGGVEWLEQQIADRKFEREYSSNY